MAMNAAEAHAMLAASQAHPNVVAQIVPSPFTFRADRTIQDLLADGYVGDLYAMTVRGVPHLRQAKTCRLRKPLIDLS
jgi:predicted dehydrogenase